MCWVALDRATALADRLDASERVATWKQTQDQIRQGDPHQPARARTVFERAAAFVDDVGLLAEEVDPVSGELLGNFPQAFSHIGLVNAAWAVSESELRETPPAESAADASDSSNRTPA